MTHFDVQLVQFVPKSKAQVVPREDGTPGCEDGRMYIEEIFGESGIKDGVYDVLESCDSCPTTNRSTWKPEAIHTQLVIREYHERELADGITLRFLHERPWS